MGLSDPFSREYRGGGGSGTPHAAGSSSPSAPSQVAIAMEQGRRVYVLKWESNH